MTVRGSYVGASGGAATDLALGLKSGFCQRGVRGAGGGVLAAPRLVRGEGAWHYLPLLIAW